MELQQIIVIAIVCLCIFFATVLWLVLHRLHGAVRTTAFTRIAIVLYALEILKDTYAYPYGAEAYNCRKSEKKIAEYLQIKKNVVPLQPQSRNKDC